MAEKKSQPDNQESSEFATQKFTPEELMGEQGQAVNPQQATQKIDDSILEAAPVREFDQIAVGVIAGKLRELGVTPDVRAL